MLEKLDIMLNSLTIQIIQMFAYILEHIINLMHLYKIVYSSTFQAVRLPDLLCANAIVTFNLRV